jgi:hypothetical protein
LHIASGVRAQNNNIDMGLAVLLAEILDEVRWFLAGVHNHTFGGPEKRALARPEHDVVAVVEVHGDVDERGEAGDRAMERNEADFNCGYAKMSCWFCSTLYQ